MDNTGSLAEFEVVINPFADREDKREEIYPLDLTKAFLPDIRKIADFIETEKRKIQSIYGLVRGGWMPAVALSHMLDIPVIVTRDNITPSTFIVDDIIHSGAAIKGLLSTLGGDNFIVGCLVFRKGAMYTPHIFARERLQSDPFIRFPLETEKSSRYDGTILE